jgi:beta-lactamase class A
MAPRPRLRLALASALALLAASVATARAQTADDLAARVGHRVALVPGARVGVVYLPLGGGEGLRLNADSSFHAASTMKVPVMVELLRQSERGGIRMDQPVLLVNSFASIADGSPF